MANKELPMSARPSHVFALLGASLVWASCGGSGEGSGTGGTGGGTIGSAGTTGGAGVTGTGGTSASGTAGTSGQAGSAGGSGGVSTGAAGDGTPGTGGSAAGQGGGPGVAGRGGAGGGNPGNGGRGGSTGVAGSGPGTGGSVAGQGGGPGVAGRGGSSAGAGGAPAGTGGLPGSYDKENTGADCPAPPAPVAFSALPTIANLPDPFLMTNGTRITTKDQWRCRRAEISSIVQSWESGPKGAPPTSLTATLSGGKLTVVATQGSTSITLSGTISTPSGNGPFPLIIGMNTPTGSLPASIFTGHGVATMTFTSSQLVPDAFNVPRGGGAYFTAYPDKNAGAMIEWAWGVSRLIDGLYKTADTNKIDLKRIGVTGCSYQGKMALYAGAFDERIALTIPEESGGGGEASWRFMATQTGTEDLEAAQGTAWYAQTLLQFKNKDAPKLPIDMHELVAMVAPRAILAIENTAIDRLGSQAGSVSMKAATEVWKALGVPDRIGFTQAAASAHCSFPSSQTADVQAFVDKFLGGMASVNTNIAKSSYNTDLTKWITWTTPTLQ
jgi:hypothetical protein